MTDLDNAVASLKTHLPTDFKPSIGLILGSGLSELMMPFEIINTIDYDQIEGFPRSTAPSHAGRCHAARYQSTSLLIFDGRFHLYEGWSAKQAAMPIYLSKRLGINNVIITNAVGALNPDLMPGDVLLVNDHLNFTGHSPLIGDNDDSVGSRFPDMSQAYDQVLRTLARQQFEQHDITVKEGIYAGVLGPQLETSAERRFLRLAGADVVGMSLVMETIAANHCGMSVLAITAVTNSATGDENQQPDTIEQVLTIAAIAAKKMRLVLPDIISRA